MCPNNPIGTVDLYLVSHHGTDPSGSAALVHALQPRVAIMQNGTRKGAGTQTMQTLHTSPGLEDIWQLHWAYGAGIEQNRRRLHREHGRTCDDRGGAHCAAAGRRAGPRRAGCRRTGRGSGRTRCRPDREPADRVQRHRDPDRARADPVRVLRLLVRRPRVGRASRKREDQQPAALLRRRVHHLQQVLSQGRWPGRTGRRARWRRRGGAHPGLLDQGSGEPNGTFTVTNSRNNFSKTYTKR